MPTNSTLKKYQKDLILWAADCAEHVLPYFEKENPRDNRPRKAIETARAWTKGKIKFKEIRSTSLSSHAAARKTNNLSAKFAARSAGQAVATAHVPQHAFGASYYALKIAANSINPDDEIIKELNWEYKHLPKHLRQEFKKWQYNRLPKNLLTIVKRSKFFSS